MSTTNRRKPNTKRADEQVARTDETGEGISRRKFFALLGASAAVASAAGCADYQDRGKIVPHNKRPNEARPGEIVRYASTCKLCSEACGLLVKTVDGRPVHVEGNPDHPISGGKICERGQAAIYDLYDPARVRNPKRVGGGKYADVGWKDVDDAVAKAFDADDERKIFLFARPDASPSLNKYIRELKERRPNVETIFYEQFSQTSRTRAWKRCYGEGSAFPSIKWDEAKVVLALDSDLLGAEIGKVERRRLFAKTRDVGRTVNFSRLYAVEGAATLTGFFADERIRLRPEFAFDLALALVNEIANVRNESTVPLSSELYDIAKTYTLAKVAEESGVDAKKLRRVADDLTGARGKAIVYAGDALPERVHVVVNLLNAMIDGERLYRKNAIDAREPAADLATLKRAADAMRKGEAKLAIFWNVNPAYDLPADLKFAEAIEKTPTTVALAALENETTKRCDFLAPIHHELECWGDANPRSDVYSLRQPTIRPLYDTRQAEDALLSWTAARVNGERPTFAPNAFRDLVKAYWKETVHPLAKSAPFKAFWNAALRAGVVRVTPKEEAEYLIRRENLAEAMTPRKKREGLTLIVAPSYALGDGALANNGWLQELPHPVTKITWDNHASLSKATAEKLGVATGDMIEATIDGRSATLPVLVQPGLADGVIAMETGYGRTDCPVVAEKVGTNVNPLVASDESPFVITGATAKKVAGSYPLAATQDHYAFDDPLSKDRHTEREIIQEGALADYKRNPAFLHEGWEPHMYQIYDPHDYPEEKWGMAIDLNKCIGCSTCVAACDSENNVPVVGKEEVANGREMHWMRIDRYYGGDPDEPRTSYQPMLCQHCDAAPCENVCPVVATTHSVDGLNQMVYNRCVGTRYCSNNCPYKVRRFNFYDYRRMLADGYYEGESMELKRNPEVTVRSRGVMEKCTFCVQRIQDERYRAAAEGRALDAANVRTACQVACPTDAIIFGDLNDENSAIAETRKHELGYAVLKEMNTKPNVTYVAKLRNTHSEDA
ncbi:MAG: 4Fe-4S dicluster domain-containing protein [Ignavibacteriales bacterium]|nr:4Fe-4S dicluster domain-containing protein [Ignavibacteriales bacterium]